MDEKVYFQAKNLHDSISDREYLRYIHFVAPLQIIKRIGICGMLLYVADFADSLGRFLTLLYIGLVLVSHIATWLQLRNKIGVCDNKQGRRPSVVIASVLDTHIQLVDPVSQSSCAIEYGDFRRYTETDHLLLLMDCRNSLLRIDKRELQGGTKEQLIDFLYSRCPKLKKALLTETVGMILAAAYVIVLAMFLVLAIFA